MLVAYLALANGGYGAIVRNEVAVILWWLVLVGALAGLLPTQRISRAGWLVIAALTAFGAWAALGLTWTESAERSVNEVARVAAYLGVFALTLSTQGRDGLRRTIGAVGAAIALVALIALLSRLVPGLFPAGDPSAFLGGSNERLTYPLNYWNGLAALMAIGLPLLLAVAVRSERRVTQMAATAGVPILALTAYFTFSRAGVLAAAVAVLVLVVLERPRTPILRVLGVTGAGSALMIAAASGRDALGSGSTGPIASNEGEQMIELLIITCAAVSILRLYVGISPRRARRSGPSLSPTARRISIAALAAGVIAAGLIADLPGELSDRWQEFKSPEVAGFAESRFESVGGAGRYQFWGAAIDAFESEPLTGIGAGTYEFWWARNAAIDDFVRDAHSLYLESLAELGPVGLLLIGAVLVILLRTGVLAARRTTSPRRTYLASAVSAISAFAVTASLDWVWELAVLPVAVLVIGAAVCASGPDASPSVRRRKAGPDSAQPRTAQVVLIALAVPALILLSTSLLAEYSMRDSRDAVLEQRLDDAQGSAERARDLQPWAASPRIQLALVLERRGELGPAAAAATEATEREATNWRNWLILARLEASRGRVAEAIEAFGESASLNSRSPGFAPTTVGDSGG